MYIKSKPRYIEANERFRVIILCISFPLLFSLITSSAGFYPETETLGSWLQRCGIVMVVFGLLGEVLLIKFNRVFDTHGELNQEIIELNKILSRKSEIANYTIFLLVITGTMLSGFGDLFIN